MNFVLEIGPGERCRKNHEEDWNGFEWFFLKEKRDSRADEIKR
jgi:hypothetical protein